ncbi:MAG: hypothetical protein ACI810_002470, partial [Gammaproteobacteria bacterium]
AICSNIVTNNIKLNKTEQIKRNFLGVGKHV